MLPLPANFVDRKDFWGLCAGRQGVVWVVVWRSWKDTADHVGIDAIELLGGAYEGLLRRSMSSARVVAGLSSNVVAPYWDESAEAEAADAQMGYLLPLSVQFGPLPTVVGLEIATSIVSLAADSDARAVFEQVRAAVDEILVTDAGTLPFQLADPFAGSGSG